MIISYQQLINAYLKARKGKSKQHSLIEFDRERKSNLKILYNELLNDTYCISKPSRFIVIDPVPREIIALLFRDKIVQHLICFVFIEKKNIIISMSLVTNHILPFEYTIYIDEAGRGPFAGPVVVWGLVVRPGLSSITKSTWKDSKQLTAHRRDILYNQICQEEQNGRLVVATGSACAQEIDQLWIIVSLQRACVRMIAELIKKSLQEFLFSRLRESVRWEDHIALIIFEHYLAQRDTIDYDWLLFFVRVCIAQPQKVFLFKWLLIDWNHTFGLDTLLWCHVQTIIRGDSKVPMISASSIVAKVTRDRIMIELDHIYPGRWFARHKGYGTKSHREMLLWGWITPEHRLTYIRKTLWT